MIRNFLKSSSMVAISVSALMTANDVSGHPAHRCDACLTDAQFEGVALQHAATAHGVHYVYSMPNGMIARYEVHRQCAGDQPWSAPEDSADQRVQSRVSAYCQNGYQYQITQTNVEPEVALFFGDMVNAWQSYGNSFHALVNLSYPQDFSGARGVGVLAKNQPASAYQFITDGNFRNSFINTYNLVIDGMNNPHTIRRLLNDTVGFSGWGISFNLSGNSSLKSRIQFQDGSSLYVRVIDGSRVEYVPGTAMDGNGATIPDYSHSPVSGGGYGTLYGGWNPDNLENWLTAAAQAGIPIRYGSGGSSSYIVSCMYVAGKLIECIVHQG
ncbi:hypothetical protein OS187_11450 [Xanthomonadaceae bacterium JHOS43]|nr:hypothetical protein [Xanthomonadaceae bacterium JHOS43]